ncbi:MAG: polysaccharide biosynthesis tyrosine autokinase [Planctomycetes bacterium]|nr:polysaccharide biosynthesis tyrosine autokinase [Planctomycetota bacterium]
MTQALALKGRPILEEALKVAAVRETTWFKSIRQPREFPVIELEDDLRVTPLRGTNYIRVKMMAPRKEDPAIVVNAVVERWHESVKRRAAQELASEPLKDYQEELRTLQGEIRNRRTRLKDLQSKLPAGANQAGGISVAQQQVGVYTMQVADKESQLAQLGQFRQIYNAPQAPEPTSDDRAEVEAGPQVAALRQQLLVLEQTRTALATKFGPAHAELRNLDAQIEAAHDKLDSRRFEALRERFETLREQTNTAYLNTQYALLQDRENLAQAEAALKDQEQLLFTYGSEATNLNRNLITEAKLIERIADLNRVVRTQTAVKINISQPAFDPLVQNSPSLLVLPLGIFLAMVLALGTALGLELLDKSVRTPQQLVRHLTIPLLGVVPHADDEDVAIDRPETAVRDAPQSLTAEAFRRIRTNLRYSAPAARQRTILVTSPRINDGKTTVSSNLALSCAFDGQRVLLMDASLRRPGMRHAFEKIGERGLSNILVGEAPFDSCVTHTELSALDLLGTGPISPNPVELLGSELFRKLLTEVAGQYDKIILDTAPVLLTSDALVLAPVVDGVVVVVRAAANTRGAVQRACSLLKDVNAHILGAVLNAAQVTRGGYFREQLRDFYNYQADTSPEETKKLPKS